MPGVSTKGMGAGEGGRTRPRGPRRGERGKGDQGGWRERGSGWKATSTGERRCGEGGPGWSGTPGWRGWKQFVVDAREADQEKKRVKKAFACSRSDPGLPFLAQPPHRTFPPPLSPYLTPPLPLPITPPPLGPAPALAATAGGFLARRHALDVHPLHPPTHPPRRRQPPQAPQATTPQPVPAHPPPEIHPPNLPTHSREWLSVHRRATPRGRGGHPPQADGVHPDLPGGGGCTRPGGGRRYRRHGRRRRHRRLATSQP